MVKLPRIRIDPEVEARLEHYRLLNPKETDSEIAANGVRSPGVPRSDASWFRVICALREVSRHSQNDFNYLHLAHALAETGDLDAALGTLNALEKSGTRFLGYSDDPTFRRGRLLEDHGQFHDAIAEFERCARKYPESADEIGVFVGIIHHRLRHFDRAAALYRRFLARKQKSFAFSAGRLEGLLAAAQAGDDANA